VGDVESAGSKKKGRDIKKAHAIMIMPDPFVPFRMWTNAHCLQLVEGKTTHFSFFEMF